MTKNRRNGGFTLAEMLIVVAIVIVLMGVAFVAVQNYQRSSTRMEFDTIAKEIFVAAQNHLTEAESQGLLDALGEDIFGTKGTLTEDKIDGKQEVYYILNGSTYDEALKLLLPNYAVDATVLAGSYIIRYQPSSGTVLDVFYSRPGNPTFLTKSGTTFTEGEYGTLMTDGYRTGGERKRENYNGSVIGWYGGGEPIPKGERLRAPTFEVHNEETLWVKVTDQNTYDSLPNDYLIKLIVIGKSSEAEKYFDLINEKSDDGRVTDSYKITLDDITQKDMHFADLDANTTKTFIPGEDLEIKVVAYRTNTLANVAMSASKTTNSLFADPKSVFKNGSDVDNKLASIANIRHLENLDAAVSKLEDSDDFAVTKANQIEDLSWTDFMAKTGKENTVVYSGATPTEKGCYYPVSPDHAIEYDGQNHSVSNVKVNFADSAGMFGTLPAGSSVSNLELIDFDITATSGNAGALVGTATGTTITNVLAYNDKTTGTSATVTASSGDAGGLIGSATNCEVTKCAAALVVGSKTIGENNTITPTNAGGLIGSVSGDNTTISQSYSGGYMKQIFAISKDDLTDDEEKISVTGTGSAGGLIGSMSGGKVEKCASGVIVTSTGGDAGGLIGKSSTGTVSASYAAGHTVSGKPDGAAEKYDSPNNTVYPVRYDAENYNVTGSTTAGGLIGNAGSTAVSNCYSTCSAKGATAGGFVGTGTGKMTNCYCTGLVEGTNAKGAFTGASTANAEKCKYFEIINEVPKDNDKSKGYEYLPPLQKTGDEENAGKHNEITAFDDTVETYEAFCGGKDAWQKAEPYDNALKQFYHNDENKPLYNLKTVKQLGAADVSDSDFVATHYGDWPAPEEFVFNETA